MGGDRVLSGRPGPGQKRRSRAARSDRRLAVDGRSAAAHGARAQPLRDVRDISRIAYGFIASQALFAALELDLFSLLADGGRTLGQLADDTDVPVDQMATLLSALTSLGLVIPEGNLYRNAPASHRYLVRGAPGDFGDYYRYQ